MKNTEGMIILAIYIWCHSSQKNHISHHLPHSRALLVHTTSCVFGLKLSYKLQGLMIKIEVNSIHISAHTSLQDCLETKLLTSVMLFI